MGIEHPERHGAPAPDAPTHRKLPPFIAGREAAPSSTGISPKQTVHDVSQQPTINSTSDTPSQ
jgi:hypothetical protein